MNDDLPKWSEYRDAGLSMEEFLEDNHAARIARLTLRQRIARHWSWFWQIDLACAGLALAYVALMWLAVRAG